MIVALIIPHVTEPKNGPLACLEQVRDDAPIVEHVVRTVLRGPFGGTILVVPHHTLVEAETALEGYAVQIRGSTRVNAGPHGLLADSLQHALAFRERWQRAMEAASKRFAEPAPQRAPGTAPGADAGWSQHRGDADVKVRGLARSFERDGILLFPAEAAGLTPELQAQVVEAFARDGATPASARPFARPVCSGKSGFPIAIDIAAVEEVRALPPATDFSQWLSANAARVQSIDVNERGAIEFATTQG